MLQPRAHKKIVGTNTKIPPQGPPATGTVATGRFCAWASVPTTFAASFDGAVHAGGCAGTLIVREIETCSETHQTHTSKRGKENQVGARGGDVS